MVIAGIAGLALAALAAVAVAKSFTLGVEKNVKDTGRGNKIEIVAVSGVGSDKGFAVYRLAPETPSHPLCTSALCLQFWHPVKVSKNAKLTAMPGVRGKLRVWHHKGIYQVTLDNHPLYTFLLDVQGHKKSVASGDTIANFGGVWHLITATAPSKGTKTTTTTSTTSSMTSTSSTTSCLYPPYC
jgi:hypothetical protein